MIYLIESLNYYKIGYTNNWEERRKAYFTTNPNYKLIDLREGSNYDEKELHKRLKKYNCKTEWFNKVQEVLDVWNDYFNNIDKVKINFQHVQLPNSMTESENITAKDLVIYLSIKRHNGEKGCFPSLETISKESGAAINTVRKCIDNLIKDKWISKEKRGKFTYYAFSPYKNFEPFSYEFLDKEDLTFIQKSYLAASQQYMYIDGPDCGKISMSNKELANKIKLSESTVSKCNKALEEKHYLTIIDTKSKDVVTGCTKGEKIFALQQFGQAVAYAIKNHEDRITENTEDIKSLKKDNELLMREIQSLKEQLNKKENIIL